MAEKRICSQCDHYKFGASVGPISGYCEAYPLPDEPNTYKEVRFNTDATKCPKFKEIEEILTDAMEGIYHPHQRLYGEIPEEELERKRV